MGPSVPVENLETGERGMAGRAWYIRENVEVHGEPYEEYFIKLGVSAIFIRNGNGAYGCDVRDEERARELDVPRASTPQRKPLWSGEKLSLAVSET